MIQLVIHVVFLVLLAALIGLNASIQTTLNLFGFRFEDVSLIVVILLSFVVGALYALFAFFAHSLERRKHDKQKGRMERSREREAMLDEREKGMGESGEIRRTRQTEFPPPYESGRERESP